MDSSSLVLVGQAGLITSSSTFMRASESGGGTMEGGGGPSLDPRPWPVKGRLKLLKGEMIGLVWPSASGETDIPEEQQ